MPFERDDDYQFLNPYNFVRCLEEPTPSDKDLEGKLLARCEPPPHDRYLGLSGRIECILKVKTPLFVSDAHDVEKDENSKHKTYHFFRYGGVDAIPASSLRGMVRSVFETVTNSCFSVFDGRRLSYRLNPSKAPSMVPARVEKGENGDLCLRLFSGFAELALDGNPQEAYAAMVPQYYYSGNVDLHDLDHKDECYALVEPAHKRWIVRAIRKCEADLPDPEVGEEIVQGWLFITNRNINRKRNERFFFPLSSQEVKSLDSIVVKNYEALIKEFQDRYKQQTGALAGLHISRHITDEAYRDLKVGDLVYASLSSDGVVEFIAPVAISRVWYEKSIGDLLPEHLRTCTDYDALCPACRVFGWVYGAHDEQDQKLRDDKVTAYAGRLCFSHGELTHDAGVFDPAPLAILSSPNPTTTRFYLAPKDGDLAQLHNDQNAVYNDENVLRGRKFYRHHGEAKKGEYERATDHEHDGRDEQNRTVCGVRKPENQFTFTVDFHNLAPVELGALLWALKLEGELCHRLGFAKPLGFGSVIIEIKSLKCLDPGKHYENITKNNGWVDISEKTQEGWVNGFKNAIERVYGQPFKELINIRDLRALLKKPSANTPIHYPRPSVGPRPDGKNFVWFMGNKRWARLYLPFATDESDRNERLPRIY